jgi:hypothetical protein
VKGAQELRGRALVDQRQKLGTAQPVTEPVGDEYFAIREFFAE